MQYIPVNLAIQNEWVTPYHKDSTGKLVPLNRYKLSLLTGKVVSARLNKYLLPNDTIQLFTNTQLRYSCNKLLQTTLEIHTELSSPHKDCKLVPINPEEPLSVKNIQWQYEGFTFRIKVSNTPDFLPIEYQILYFNRSIWTIIPAPIRTLPKTRPIRGFELLKDKAFKLLETVTFTKDELCELVQQLPFELAKQAKKQFDLRTTIPKQSRQEWLDIHADFIWYQLRNRTWVPGPDPNNSSFFHYKAPGAVKPRTLNKAEELAYFYDTGLSTVYKWLKANERFLACKTHPHPDLPERSEDAPNVESFESLPLKEPLKWAK